MELFKLFGTIALDNAGANQGIDETTDKAEKAHPKISAAFTKIGDAAVKAGKVIASGLAVGATAMAGLATKALSLGGELEQNMGGSEAVFAEYAEKMQETAGTAFSSMGLSASDFLATANKMGALFQGAGFSIEESANLSAEAMQRAADVASIMGLDTSAAMEAIAGAAKGNFTMMDNLGVAMNDTAIQNYALSKGIEKTTAEMTQQEKIALAMEMFLEKTAYAAGNYSKENQTLAGSLGTAKAALTNFLSGAGDVDSLVGALVNAGNVIATNLQALLPRLVTGLNSLITQLLPYVPPLMEALLPGIIDGSLALMTGLIAMLPQILQILIEQIPGIIVQIGSALVSAFPVLLQTVKNLFGQIWDYISLELLNTGVSFEEAFAKIQVVFEKVFGVIKNLWDNSLKPIFTGITTFLSGVFTGNWKKAWQGIQSIFTGIWEGIKTAFKLPINWIIDGINKFIGGINKIKIPDWVPAVGGKGFNIKEIPKLEQGGILERGQVGLLEGTGAEAVVPLDQNQAWISAVAKDMNVALGGSGQQMQDMKQAFDRFVLDLPEMLKDAFESMKFDVNNREFARMVKAVN